MTGRRTRGSDDVGISLEMREKTEGPAPEADVTEKKAAMTGEIMNSGAQEPESRPELIVEAVLFAMGTSVETRQLAQALGCDEKQAREAARRLQREYDDAGRAIQIIELEDCFQMCTRNEYYEALVKVVKTPRKQVMTDAVMETLSIIAYRQPVTRTEIEKIRGVSSDYAINKLIDFGLVYEAGRLDVPGKPAAFATTEEFLRRFGVSSKKDLPTLDAGTEAKILKEVAREIDYRPEDADMVADQEVEGQMDLMDLLRDLNQKDEPEPAAAQETGSAADGARGTEPAADGAQETGSAADEAREPGSEKTAAGSGTGITEIDI